MAGYLLFAVFPELTLISLQVSPGLNTSVPSVYS